MDQTKNFILKLILVIKSMNLIIPPLRDLSLKYQYFLENTHTSYYIMIAYFIKI